MGRYAAPMQSSESMTKFRSRRRVPLPQRRHELVAAATRVLARAGVRGLTTRAVSAEAGAALASIHYAFDSVDDLLAAVLDASLGEIATRMRALQQTGLPLGEAVSACLFAAWQIVEGDRDLQIAQYELTLHAVRLDAATGSARGAGQYRGYVTLLTDYLAAATADGEQPEPALLEALGRHLTAGLDGLILQHLVAPDPDRSRRDLAALAAGALAAVRPGAGA